MSGKEFCDVDVYRLGGGGGRYGILLVSKEWLACWLAGWLGGREDGEKVGIATGFDDVGRSLGRLPVTGGGGDLIEACSRYDLI